MIITVTLNPAVDKTIKLNNLRLGEVNRVSMVQLDAGGKGINVSKMLKNLGEKSIATGVIGGSSGLFIKNQLNKLGIENAFVEIEGNTRTNIKLVDVENGVHTDINEAGLEIPPKALEQLEEGMFDSLKAGDILILSGSIPKNVDKAIYAKWISRTKEKGVFALLDAEGELLKAGIEAAPYAVKPNIHELEGFYGRKINSIDEIIELSKKLLDYGIKLVAVSMGEGGSIFVTEDKILLVKAQGVEVKSTVGAGDSIVGALAYSIKNNMKLKDTACLAVAAATASVSNDGTEMGTLEQIEFWKSKVEVVEF